MQEELEGRYTCSAKCTLELLQLPYAYSSLVRSYVMLHHQFSDKLHPYYPLKRGHLVNLAICSGPKGVWIRGKGFIQEGGGGGGVVGIMSTIYLY